MLLKKRWVRWAAGIGLVIILAVVWGNLTSEGIKVKVAKAGPGDILPSISVNGEIKGSSVSLGPKVLGTVSRVLAREGDRVAKGQKLVLLDTYDNALSDYLRIKELFANGFASEQQYEQSKMAYETSFIATPISGVLTLMGAKPGEPVSPGVPFISVVNASSAYAEIQIDEADIGDVKKGQTVNIYADAYQNETFSGTLINIGQEAELKKVAGRVKMDEEDKIFRARVAVKDSGYKLKIGMSVNADVITDKISAAVLVPREAVVVKDEKQLVYAVNKGKAKALEIKIGKKDSVNAQIIEGIKAGEDVVITNLDKISDGAKVKLEKETSK